MTPRHLRRLRRAWERDRREGDPAKNAYPVRNCLTRCQTGTYANVPSVRTGGLSVDISLLSVDISQLSVDISLLAVDICQLSMDISRLAGTSAVCPWTSAYWPWTFASCPWTSDVCPWTLASCPWTSTALLWASVSGLGVGFSRPRRHTSPRGGQPNRESPSAARQVRSPHRRQAR
jgi:hypothetical protein